MTVTALGIACSPHAAMLGSRMADTATFRLRLSEGAHMIAASDAGYDTWDLK